MDIFIDNYRLYLQALVTTLSLMGAGLASGFILAVPIGLLAIEGPRPIRFLTTIHMTFFRGTPLLVQVFMIYYGLGQIDLVRHSFLWTVFKEPFFCAVLALALNTSAYTANIIKGAVLSVPKGEVEAGQAFGFSRLKLYSHIIAPSALRLFLPAYGSEVIIILKATSLASTITLLDLTGLAKNLMSRTFRPFETFFITALIYVTLVFILTRIFKIIESQATPKGEEF
ncbi:MAG: ABC transporter permease subunit [Deltaproteobacteria bacterium]|jgi:octopine/nopaline transport system permease protein|nr:ABC transporter permease subunit [Deltaproteobacteria bacterium]